MQGRLVVGNPACPKCKSYMFMPRIANGVRFRLCKNCGFKGLGKRQFTWKAFKVYMERFMFWR
jgi:ribosomal protein L37AE/L43A